jgi:pimeloyl-ACP methyl ester carboxylesterase
MVRISGLEALPKRISCLAIFMVEPTELGVAAINDFVTHDIGNMVGYAFAARSPDRATRFVSIDGTSSWRRTLGADRSRSAHVAVWLRRPRYGAPGCRSRTHLFGPVLE